MCLAIPGKIETVSQTDDQLFRTAKVRFGGVVREVNTSLVPEAGPGDYVLVHVGVAISKVDEEEARLTMEYMKRMGELDDLETDAV